MDSIAQTYKWIWTTRRVVIYDPMVVESDVPLMSTLSIDAKLLPQRPPAYLRVTVEEVDIKG